MFSFVYLSNNRVNGKGETSCLNTPICARPVPKKTTVSNVANGVEVQNISHVFAVAAAAVLTVASHAVKCLPIQREFLPFCATTAASAPSKTTALNAENRRRDIDLDS